MKNKCYLLLQSMSGSRILLSLMSALKNNKAKYGVASLCNGGGKKILISIRKEKFCLKKIGGATAMLIENLQN